MRTQILKTIAFCSLALIGLTGKAQGLEDIVVEQYHVLTAADAAAYTGAGSYSLAAGMKCYRVYVDMAPGYKLNRVYGSPAPIGGGPSPNPLDITTTTTFWNEDVFATTQFPGPSQRIDQGLLFDSYLTINRTGTSGGSQPNACGAGATVENVGVLRTGGEDTQTPQDQTTCSVFPGFTASGPSDGNIPGTAAAVQGFVVTTDFNAFTADGNTFTMVNDAWTTFPGSLGPTTSNRVLIAQLTTSGNLSFHINVELSSPTDVLSAYVWNQAGAGEVVDARMTYPPACLPATVNSITSNSPICSNQSLSLNATVFGSLPITYGWTGTGTFSPNNTSEDVTVTGAASGTYTLTVNNACGTDVENHVVTVNPASTWYADADADGAGDPGVSQPSCVQPVGYVSNSNDLCPTDHDKIAPGQCGCGVPDTDGDGDGTANCNDGCPTDPNKIAPGICGCGVADTDSDGDGTANCNDGCPNDPNKTAPGICGCGVADTDSDGDGTANCNDGCPNDPNKIAAGVCGCGNPEPGTVCNDGDPNTTGDVIGTNCLCAGSTVPCPDDGNPCTFEQVISGVCQHTPLPDGDGDGTCDAIDGCPTDPNKIAPGICGCGVADTDSDGDGTANCNDGCPNDPNKTAPGICGCGVADTDSDGDGTANCNDGCPNDPNKTAPGICGCGVADTDSDGDGTANCNDGCPNDPNKIAAGVCGCGNPEPGTVCNDGDPNTTGDVIGSNCLCAGSTVPCPDDGNPCTLEQVISGVCQHTPLPDSDGDGTCDAIDGCPNDPNKIAPGICGCGVADTDSDGDGTANCNDGCPNDPNKIAAGVCGCGNPEPGASCNDGNPNTSFDVVGANCICAGTPNGGCTEILNLDITLDNLGSETTVQLWNDANTVMLEQRGPYGNGLGGTVVTEQFCVAVGCYRLKVLDSGNNGISGGGYVLKNAAGKRIIDATGLFTSVSTLHVNTPVFCVPISNQRLITASCDRTDLTPNTVVYCTTQPGATTYEFWWYDPHGTYTRKMPVPTPSMKPKQMVTNPVPLGLDLNVRVRALVGGVYTAYGPACRARVNGSAVADEASYYSLPNNEGPSTTLSIHPNPNRDGVVYLEIDGLEDASRTVTIDVYDLFGKRVHAEQITVSGEIVNHVMDLSADLAMGMYVVNVSFDDQHFTQRLIKQ